MVSFISLAEWFRRNLAQYAAETGDDTLHVVAAWLGEDAWRRVLEVEVDGQRLLDILTGKCLDNPLTPSEDYEEWTRQFECVAEMIRPFAETMAPKLRKIPEATERFLKHIDYKEVR